MIPLILWQSQKSTRQPGRVFVKSRYVLLLERVSPIDESGRAQGKGTAMSNLQLEYTEDELLASNEIAEPLFAGSVKCHGGFDGDGNYVSPRTRFRWPAILAWQQAHIEKFGAEILDISTEIWPEHYPNVAQAKFLISNGVPEPVISTLTRIGTVEGFGALIRYSTVPDMQKLFSDDITGTALAHLDRGLFEAHARDEAGFEDEGGHRDMWFAARDIAFEHPVTEDETALMLERMGIPAAISGTARLGASYGGPPESSATARAYASPASLSEIDFDLELLIERMVRLLLIEISAHHVFAWAEEVLSDSELIAGNGEAARLVSYIRADEASHVAYLRTVLSEIRERNLVTTAGQILPGASVIDAIWERACHESLGPRRVELLDTTLREVELAIPENKRELLEEFHSLGSCRPDDEGTWIAADDRPIEPVRDGGG